MFLRVFSHFFVLAADEMPSPLSLPDAQYQHQAMVRSIELNLNNSIDRANAFEEYVFQGAQNRSNECAWRGVHCKDTIITSFFFFARPMVSQLLHWELDLNWLPSSLEVIHLNEILPASPWVPERLPRKLRFFFFWGVPKPQKASPNVSLRNLPNAIEEMHLINSWPGGPFMLINLPASMRFFSILQWNLQRLYVDNASLSDSLEVLNIHADARKKCIPSGEAEWDPRVKQFADGSEFFKLIRSSKMCMKYFEIAERHRFTPRNKNSSDLH